MKVAMGLAVLLAFAPAGDLTIGGDVPDIALKSLDGKEAKLADLKTKVVAIVSWSSDCPSGKPTIARSTAVAKEFADNDKVAFYAVSSYGDKEEKLKTLIKELEIKYPIVCDSDKSIAKTLGARQVNSAYVIKEGKLFWRGGVTKNGKDDFAAAIKAALDGKEAPASDKKFGG